MSKDWVKQDIETEWYVDDGVDHDPYHLRRNKELPGYFHTKDIDATKEFNYTKRYFRVDTPEQCEEHRKRKRDACNVQNNPGHDWVNERTGTSKNICRNYKDYVYDKQNHKKYSDESLLNALKKARDGYMKCSNERTMFDEEVMVGDYGEQCATYGGGYQDPVYQSHKARVGVERTYADECQDIIDKVNYKVTEEERLKKSEDKRVKSKSKSHEKSRKKSKSKKKSPKKSTKKSPSDFPFTQVEHFLSVLKRFQEEQKPLNQKLSGNIVTIVPDEFSRYDELWEIKKAVDESKQNPKELFRVDALVKRVTKVLDKYKSMIAASSGKRWKRSCKKRR